MASDVFKSIRNTGVETYTKLKTAIFGVQSETDKLKKKTSGLGDSFDSLKKVVGLSVLGFSMKEIGMESLEAAAKMQRFTNIINFSSTGSKDAALNLSYLRDNADKLGLDVEKSAEAFSSMLGAFRGTTIQGAELRKAYEGVTIASSAMGLSGEQTQGAILAISQMMSKGKVSAEELRGQLGERLPGAMAIAARSIGVSQAALDDMMKKGKLISADFIPKFTAQLKTEFKDAAEKAANSMQANMNRIKNLFFETKVAIGEYIGPGLRFMMDMIGQVRAKFYLVEPALINFWGNIKRAAGVVMEIGQTIWHLVSSMLGFKEGATGVESAMNGLNTILNVVNPVLDFLLVTVSGVNSILDSCGGLIKWVTYLIVGWKVAMWALNIAMDANPIGLLVAGIAALAAGITYAYQRFAPFRAVMVFMKDALVEMFPLLKSFGMLLVSAFTFDGAGIVTAFNDIKSQFANLDLGALWDKTKKQAEADVAANKAEAGQDQASTTSKSKSYDYNDYFKGGDKGTKKPGAGADADKDKKKGSGGSGKALTVNINKLIENLTVKVESSKDLGNMSDVVSKAIINAIRDVEESYT